MLGGLAIVLVGAWAAHAEPITQTITAPEVLVRSGPGPAFYPTSSLRRGDTVRVVSEEVTGWLAIVPPPRSFSWMNTRFVNQISNTTAVVTAAAAPVRAGSRLLNQEPTVERIQVPKGTIVTVIGKPERARDGSTWLPILPVPTEVRYIPAETVRPGAPPSPQFAAAAPTEPVKPSPAQAGSVVPGPAATTYAAGSPPPSTLSAAAPPTPSPSTNRLQLQAEEAERAGNLTQAQTLWKELAEQVKSTDHALWLLCINRLQALQERCSNQTPAQPPSPVPASANANPDTTSGRLMPSPAPSGPAAPPRAASQYVYQQDSGYTARLTSPIATTPNAPPVPPAELAESGRLRRTAFFVDGKPAYRLEPIDGKNGMWLYVTAGGTVSLEPYVEKVVSLSGPTTYRGDLRTNYMVVQQVRPLNGVR
jgi:hypothetical protein